MNPVSRLDRLMAQLRVQLQQRERPAAIAQSRAGQTMRQRSPLQAIGELRAAGITDERMLVSCLLQELLVQEWGDSGVNESRFQQLLQSLTVVLMEDAESLALCRACLAEA